MRTDMAPCRQSLMLSEAIQSLPAAYRPSFITPLVCGLLSFGRFEIQPYGGKELFEVLTDDTPWPSFDPLAMAVDSLVKIAEACFALIDDTGLFITDMKPENMVVHDNGVIRLIDLEYTDLRSITRKRVVFTLNQSYLPIQFINPAFFPDPGNRRTLLRHYLRKAPTQDVHIMERPLSLETRQRISKFTVVWALVHILYFIVEFKYPAEKALLRQVTKVLNWMKRGRR